MKPTLEFANHNLKVLLKLILSNRVFKLPGRKSHESETCKNNDLNIYP